jgi:antitoxin VapB
MASLVITPEIEADLNRLAKVTGTTPAEAVAAAVREKLASAPVQRAIQDRASRIDELIRQLHALPVDMSLTEDEILGYDEDGIPEQPYLGR